MKPQNKNLSSLLACSLTLWLLLPCSTHGVIRYIHQHQPLKFLNFLATREDIRIFWASSKKFGLLSAQSAKASSSRFASSHKAVTR